MKFAISIENLVKDYKNHKKAVDIISLNISESSIFGLLGRNGAGKSTLISMICGILKPTRGTIKYFGELYGRHLKSKIGIVPQNIALYPSLTILENLKFFSVMQNIPKSNVSKVCDYYIDFLELSSHANHFVSSCSGGIKRRVNLAVALLNNPKILLLDEPTVGIDPYSRSLIYSKVKECAKNGMSVLYSTHYIDEIPKIADFCCIIDNGKILENDSPYNLMKKYSSKKIFIKIKNPLNADLINKFSSLQKIELSSDKKEICFFYKKLTDDIFDAISFLRDKGIIIEEITSQKENMEEVFLQITKGCKDIL